MDIAKTQISYMDNEDAGILRKPLPFGPRKHKFKIFNRELKNLPDEEEW